VDNKFLHLLVYDLIEFKLRILNTPPTVPLHWKYEVCLKSNKTVHTARKTFIAEKKTLLSMMSQCLMVLKTKFQSSVTTTFFFARFSVKALSL